MSGEGMPMSEKLEREEGRFGTGRGYGGVGEEVVVEGIKGEGGRGRKVEVKCV